MRVLASTALVVFSTFVVAAAENEAHWPQFRGPNASGQTHGPAVPTTWDVETGKNVRWKTVLPGLGLSSPVIWGDRIYVTAAVSGDGKEDLRVGLFGDITPVKDNSEHQFLVIALDRHTGEVAWQNTAHTGVPKIKRHAKSSHANATIAVDANHVVAMFGSEGLFCFDHDGKLLWKQDLGVLDSGFFRAPDAQWGYGSSPVLYKGRLIVQADVQKDSFIAVFNAKNGKVLWQRGRNEVPTWSTPTVVRSGDRTLVVCNGWKEIAAYDLSDGTPVWHMVGLGDIPVPTPIAGHGLIYITNSHGGGTPIYAVDLAKAKGEISLRKNATRGAGMAWATLDGGAYMPTPVLVGDLLFVIKDIGALVVYDAKTGSHIYEKRVGRGRSGFTASPVTSGGNVYIPAETGEIYVVRAARKFEPVAENDMGEVVMATPAIADGALFVRGQRHLFAIGEVAD